MKKTINNFSRVLCALMLCAGFALVGCTDDPLGGENTEQGGNNDGDDSGESATPVSVSLGKVTAATVQFDMTLDLKAMSQYEEAGLIFSSVDDLDISAEKATVFQINRESYSKVFTGLTYNTKYYYTTYLKKGTFYLYGDKKEFTTPDVLLELSAGSITATSAQITGIVEGLSESDKSLIEVGMLYSSESGNVENGEGTKLTASEIPSDNAVSFDLSDLIFGTKYYYCSYVKQGDGYVYGEVKTFDTIGALNLSATSTANCYIVPESGAYKFKPVKGNSATSVGSVSSVAVLWESFGTSTTPSVGDLIKLVSYSDGYIYFLTADTFKEGNAVIAAKDASGEILWSWHIWFTDQPQGQVYYNNVGTMMDRNLGATSVTPGDVGALGLLYQWGRKDPFLGSSSISSNTVAKSTISWPSPVSTNSSRGTVSYVTANPTTFVTAGSSSDYDWHYSSRDNTLWTTSDKTKSIYDPCPVGWRVPDGGSNGIWSKAGFADTEYDSTNKGISFSISSSSTTWYPASGYRNDNDGGLNSVGYHGRYWSASPYSYYAYYLFFSYDGRVNPSNYYYRARGYSVRCLQVIDEVAGANAKE